MSRFSIIDRWGDSVYKEVTHIPADQLKSVIRRQFAEWLNKQFNNTGETFKWIAVILGAILALTGFFISGPYLFWAIDEGIAHIFNLGKVSESWYVMPGLLLELYILLFAGMNFWSYDVVTHG